MYLRTRVGTILVCWDYRCFGGRGGAVMNRSRDYESVLKLYLMNGKHYKVLSVLAKRKKLDKCWAFRWGKVSVSLIKMTEISANGPRRFSPLFFELIKSAARAVAGRRGGGGGGGSVEFNNGCWQSSKISSFRPPLFHRGGIESKRFHVSPLQ